MKNNKVFKTVLLFPVIFYTLFLIALPLLYIFVISFFKSDSYGGMLRTFSLINYLELFNGSYIKIFYGGIYNEREEKSNKNGNECSFKA